MEKTGAGTWALEGTNTFSGAIAVNEGTLIVRNLAGGWNGSLAEDGTITVELQAITGATSELGYTKLGAYTL
ncbi:MAG: autotransporter-associated beta strand repeat-containing protein [Synergistaceae bacterium]|nr:autotransporter-associated beta strand repeat-containing protein [Synergistaceae bacterium]